MVFGAVYLFVVGFYLGILIGKRGAKECTLEAIKLVIFWRGIWFINKGNKCIF